MYWRLPFILLFILLTGCSLQQEKEEPQPVPVEEPAPKPVVVVPPPPPPPEVAILVSSDISAYREVADVVASRLGARAKSWYLQGSREQNAKIMEEIADSERQQVVAIGLDAAVSAKGLDNRQVIFCQVFNYEDQKLPSAMSKGVGMLPSFEKSFSAWKAISPELEKIAIITGPGLKDYVHRAALAAKSRGILVLHREVSSDKELLVVYKDIAEEVQGYWLWPDNRVLSRFVIRDIMTFSVRSGKQVVVFNDELLSLGGLLSVTSDHRDIANNVIERLERAQGMTRIPGPDIELLNDAHLRINPVMAKRFGLTVPEHYRKYLNAP